MRKRKILSARAAILKMLKAKEHVRTSEIVDKTGVSRQTIAYQLKRLVEEGAIIKTGSTQNATYHKSTKQLKISRPFPQKLLMVKVLSGLQEDRVFEEVDRRLQLKKHLSKNVYEIAAYSFSEMLNNAIDHSQSKKATIHVSVDSQNFSFSIRDLGIGAYHNVLRKFRLSDEYEAAHHLFKGKQTTDPSRHSGEGIFFTSRIADEFTLRSHRIQVMVDNQRDDIHYSDLRNISGTAVSFLIKKRSKKSLQKLFHSFSDEGYVFSKNHVRVRLNTSAPLVSRSQARRLLNGLERFKAITFDFKGITGIGQGFADEVFRVFPGQHPTLELQFENASPAVKFMIGRARS